MQGLSTDHVCPYMKAKKLALVGSSLLASVTWIASFGAAFGIGEAARRLMFHGAHALGDACRGQTSPLSGVQRIDCPRREVVAAATTCS